MPAANAGTDIERHGDVRIKNTHHGTSYLPPHHKTRLPDAAQWSQALSNLYLLLISSVQKTAGEHFRPPAVTLTMCYACRFCSIR